MNKDGEFALTHNHEDERRKENRKKKEEAKGKQQEDEEKEKKEKKNDWNIRIQACLDGKGPESGDRPPFICRDVFRVLGEKDPTGAEHISSLSFCCVKCLRIRDADLALCEGSLGELQFTKGHITELDLPSLANCVKMSRFTLIQDNGLGNSGAPMEKMRLTRGLPVFPSTLTELSLSGIEDAPGSPPVDLNTSLVRVTALSRLDLEHLRLRKASLDFSPGFSSLMSLSVEGVDGFSATASFWSNCRSLESVTISGAGTATPLFGYKSALPNVLFTSTLRSLSLKDCDVPELPPSICDCPALASLSVTNCGLQRLPDCLHQLASLDNLSLTGNELHLEGIAVLERCDFLNTPSSAAATSSAAANGGTRAVSLMGNRLPFGCPTEVRVVAYLKALPRPDKSYAGLRHYDYRELEAATRGFSPKSLLNAEGSFGPVYSGTIGASQQVAVKVMAEATLSSEEQLRAELGALQMCRHPNLVQLLGCCIDDPRGSKCLVYELKPNGSIRSYLDKDLSTRRACGWRRRISWMLQVISALEYLHVIAEPIMIHRDIKTANILLDSSLSACIGDFGLARLISDSAKAEGAAAKGASTRIVGTPGYIDPEYARTGKITTASDIYSFGVCMIELLCSRRAFDKDRDEPALVSEFEEAVEEGEKGKDTLSALIDRAGEARWPVGGITEQLIGVIASCIEPKSKKRAATCEVAASLTVLSHEHGCDPQMLNVMGEGAQDKDQGAMCAMCVICYENVSTHAIVPCGHVCLCADDAAMLLCKSGGAGNCPMCRGGIESIMQISAHATGKRQRRG